MDISTRRDVRERAGDRCEYCRMPQMSAPFLTFHVEHIHASQHVRDDSLNNLCLACPNCNLNKGPNLSTLDPLTREIIPLFNPRQQQWNEHFQCDDGTIIGLSNIGIGTARLLKMNVPDQIQIRSALIARGEF